MEKHTSSLGLQYEDILNCRLVCTSWKVSMDHFLQNHTAQMNFAGHFYPNTVIDSQDSRHVEGLIQRLIRNYDHGNSNPFPSRHLRLRMHADAAEHDRQIFQEAVSILLKYFGKHVWYITILVNVEHAEVEIYEMIYSFLKQTETVKAVNLCFLGKCNINRTEENTNKFDSFLLQQKFPKLKSMKALKLDGSSDAIIDAALKRNKYLEKLEVYCSDGTHGWIKFRGKTPDLPILKEVTLNNIKVTQLAELKHVNWPLMGLTTKPADVENKMDLELMCEAFQHFDGTLKRLNFCTKQCNMNNLRLLLPHLEELEVHCEGKLLIDFILPLDTLQVLKVNCYNMNGYNDVRQLEIIKFKDIVKTLHKADVTNLWNLFPELREVSFALIKRAVRRRKEKVYIYYRHGNQVKRMVRVGNC